jgi:hypothetical protein
MRLSSKILIGLLFISSAHAQSVGDGGPTTGTGKTVLSHSPIFDGSPQLGIAKATNLIMESYVQFNATAVSNLPPCDGNGVGRIYAAVDLKAPTFLGKAIGGGAIIAPVFCNGVDWVAY